MTVFQLECFCNLAESLNFTQTANKMFITQPALSRTISALEQELQLPLLQRTTHNVTLTPSGKVFAEECPKLLESLKASIGKAKNAQDGKIGILKIGFQRDTFEKYVVDFLNEFQNNCPEISLELKPYGITALLNSLANRQVDAVLAGGQPPTATTASHLIASRRECVILPKNHPLAGRKSLRMEELRHENFIVMSRSVSCSGYESVISKALQAGFEAQICMQVDLVPTLMTLVACGQGISLLHEDMETAANGRIAFVPLENVPAFQRWLMWEPGNENPSLKPLITLGEQWEREILS